MNATQNARLHIPDAGKEVIDRIVPTRHRVEEDTAAAHQV
jgi:hypothetical protein